MGKLFSPESKLMEILSRVADVMILNVVLILSCLPVFTIGAAVTAMYSVCFRWNTPQEGRLLKDYWLGFRGNFKQATLMWLLVLALALVCCVDLYAARRYGGNIARFTVVFQGALVLLCIVAGYAFPILSRYHNTVKQTLKNALLLSLSHLGRTILVTVLNLLPILILMLDISLFIKLCPVLAMCYFSGTAYIIRQVLYPIFQEQEEKNSKEYAERNHKS